MDEVISKELCNGCTACFNSCQIGAIRIVEDSGGFKYPLIDKSRCINCGACKQVCPVINTKENPMTPTCYLGYANDREIVFESSSGGIFTLLANYILSINGVVIGAALDSNHKLKHIAVTDQAGLNKLKGSKYLESDMNEIFSFVKNNVRYNKILFVGTPCQVAGLKSYIKDDFNNLICVDFICNGVSAPRLFDKYVRELESSHGSLVDYSFADKTSGWEKISNKATFSNGKVTIRPNENNYMKLVLSNIPYRLSCYNCNFKLGNKYSDITLGDFKNVKKLHKDMYNDNLGCSSIIVNTDRGREIFEIINKYMTYKECNINGIIKNNQALVKSVKMPKKKYKFAREMPDKSIKELKKKYVGLFK